MSFTLKQKNAYKHWPYRYGIGLALKHQANKDQMIRTAKRTLGYGLPVQLIIMITAKGLWNEIILAIGNTMVIISLILIVIFSMVWLFDIDLDV